MDSDPLVSVIVTTFNRADLLRETLDSILSQTYNNFELIVVNDGSTDNTEEIVKNYSDSRIQYIKTDNWGGPAKPRNIGIKKSLGEYIAFCDDDDLWYPDKLTYQVEKFRNNSCGLCFTDYDYIDLNGNKIKKKHKIKKHHRKLTFNKFILSGGCIANSTVMIKRKVIDTVGLLNEDRRLIAMEDYNYWARIIHSYKLYYIEDVLMRYRVSQDHVGISPTNVNDKVLKELYLIKSIRNSVGINPLILCAKVARIFFNLILKLFH